MSAYLLGFRGAGKTTLGRRLAAELGFRFIDLDELFAEEMKQNTVGWISAHGEPAFRAEEARLLARVEAGLNAGAPPAIVALGGGITEGEASRQILRESSVPRIFLDVPAEALWERLKPSPERLKVGNLHSLKALQALLTARRPHYENISTKRVENCDINESLAELKRELGSSRR